VLFNEPIPARALVVVLELSCVLRASAVKCRSIPSIDDLDRPLIDTRSTPQLALDRQSVES